LYPSSTTTINAANNGAINFISFSRRVSVYDRRGSFVTSGTTLNVGTGDCNGYYNLYDAQRPTPTPMPLPLNPFYPTPQPIYSDTCTYNSVLTNVASQIMNATVSDAQIISAINGLQPYMINQLICIPNINNAYLFELAVLYNRPSVLQALLVNGANPCLTSDTRGRTVYRQLVQLGTGVTPSQQQSLGLLVLYGGNTC